MHKSEMLVFLADLFLQLAELLMWLHTVSTNQLCSILLLMFGVQTNIFCFRGMLRGGFFSSFIRWFEKVSSKVVFVFSVVK
jgi:hypothetical protein